MGGSLSRDLIDRFLSIRGEDMPEAVLDVVNTRVIDTLGAALSAAAVGEGAAPARALLGDRAEGAFRRRR